MSSLMHLVVENYNEIVNISRDHIVDEWLFMSSPIPICTIVILYLYFVLSWGPKFMEKREPYNLQGVLIAYNLYNVILYTCVSIAPFRTSEIKNILQIGCKNELPNELKLMFSQYAWWYFFSKVVELMDTVFFVLRKKNSHITFLHVYHHTVMAFFTWIYLKFLPGQQGIVLGLLNSWVHVFMYTYYLIAAMGPKYQKYLWWKKYMTRIQLTQFVLMLAYLLYIASMDCKTPRILTFFCAGNIILFLYLFADFYRKAYDTKSVKPNDTNKSIKVQ